MTFAEARSAFPVLERIAYLNAGTFGPLSRATMAAIEAEQQRDLLEGRAGKACFERVLELRTEGRRRIAGLLSVDLQQVALTASTTDGCNIVLAGLDLEPDDEIVTTDSEHFGLLGPLHASGARVVVTDPDPEAILAAVTPRTRLLAVSQVLWTTGAILPVHELRERAGVPVLVDAAQSVGAIPVDARGLDFLALSGQKWLCGPDSTGALVVAEPEALRVARPSSLSKEASEPDGTFVPREGAARFEPNWLSAAALSGLIAALDQVPEWRFDHARATADRCRDLLDGEVEVQPGGATLVAFRPEGDAEEVVRRLDGNGVKVRDIPGRGLVRVSCGWWTSDEDLERLVSGM